MPMIVRDQANVPRAIGEIVVRDATNTPRTINEVWVRDESNVSRRVYQREINLVATPPFVSGSSTATTITTASTTVSAVGGTPPYTHSWAIADIIGATSIVALSPSSATTAFRATGVTVDASATARDTVTDSSGLLTKTIDVSVQMVNVSNPGA